MGKGSAKVSMVKFNIKGEIADILVKTGEKAVTEIKSRAPVRAKGNEKYKNGWTSKLEDDGRTVTVYNDGDHKTLAHLLEFGHKSKSGKNVPPQEHMRPSYNKVKEEYLEELKLIKIKTE